jgi:hypothetical protein
MSRALRTLSPLLLVLLWATGCPPPCEPGTEDCPCLEGDIECRGDGLFCAEGTCRRPIADTGGVGAGCHPNNTCNQMPGGEWAVCVDGVCVEPSCPQGSLGCGCFSGGTCDQGLYCSDEGGPPRCELPDCAVGDEGCGCLPDRTCNNDESGDRLVCDGNVCQPGTCDLGAANCACRADYSCDGDLVCIDGTCGLSLCDQGDLACGCNADGSCNSDQLTCSAGQCVPTTCNQGEQGCGCYNDFTCGTTTDNVQLACSAGICVRPSCPQGTQSCGCRADATCDGELICLAGVCTIDPGVSDTETTPPENPVCYTPCEEGLVAGDGSYRPCSSEGLMAGCVDGKTCNEGSCVDPGQPPRACASESNCPDYQTCIAGQCFSNCEVDGDCSAARQCHRKVCRLPCAATDDSCPQNRFCSTTDGDTGFCLPLEPPAGSFAQLAVLGDYKIDDNALDFTSVDTGSSFTITNSSPVFQTFTISKLEHVEYEQDGLDIIETNPLPWLRMGVSGTVVVQASFQVGVDAGDSATIYIEDAGASVRSRWSGKLLVSNPNLGDRQVSLTYAELPKGKWAGKMYYFANFEDGQREGLPSLMDVWLADRANATNRDNVPNPFVQVWGRFKDGSLPGGFEEFQAMLTAVETGSWKFENVRNLCPVPGNPDPNTACYLYSNAQGFSLFSESVQTEPVPSGVVELPVSVNLDEPTGGAYTATGKIVTGETLHYAGDPQITVSFTDDPSGCTTTAGGTCLTHIDDFAADIYVGGRYATDVTDSGCTAVGSAAGDFELHGTPWLVPRFDQGVSLDEETGLRYRYECRGRTLPFDGQGEYEVNMSLAASNPVPDGKSRRRSIELVDGAMINQESMFVIFRERFPSFLGSTDEDFFAYGYMLLDKEAADLDAEAFAGNAPVDPNVYPDILNVVCSDELMEEVIGTPGPHNPVAEAETLARAVIDGVKPVASETFIGGNETAHWFCEDTGHLDGGPDPFTRVPCPVESRVEFFTIDISAYATAQEGATDLSGEPCNQNGTCQQTLNAWKTNGTYSFRENPVWRCADVNAVFCDANRDDLVVDRLFYAASMSEAVFLPIRSEIESAFRYLTRFRNRQGQGIGFAPEICIEDSDQIPYCYDPPGIEAVRDRVDCALWLYTDPTARAQLNTPTEDMLQAYLSENFSFTEEIDPNLPLPIIHDGFERHFAQLLIMLGDEAYTNAFASRFDLAGAGIVAFQGSLFEPNGINLSGAAGFEMYNLYQATQYYQMALDRFYVVGPRLLSLIQELKGLPGNPAQDVVEAYFQRLIRASSQKARAWSEVAKRYQTFNRPDLARRAIERAYTSAYLESVILARMMLKVTTFANPEDRDQIVRTAELAQLSYRSALLDMRDRYRAITDEVNFFGFAPDFIPFPALDAGDTNAFDKLLFQAKQRTAVAADKETLAIQSDRNFDVDAAAFQGELVRVRNNYENQLADICGTFEGSDGNVWPAIPRYAHLSEVTALMGDPCGLVGNGALHEAMASVELASLDFEAVRINHESVLQQIANERERAAAQCAEIEETADVTYQFQMQTISLDAEIQQSQDRVRAAQRRLQVAGEISNLMKCSIIGGLAVGGNCIQAAIAGAFYRSIAASQEAIIDGQEDLIQQRQLDISRLNAAQTQFQTLQACDSTIIDSNARIKDLWLGLATADIDVLRSDYGVRLAISSVQKLRHDATRLMAEQEESEQLAINLEAARNDPNVRIYKNDAILTADRTFEAAVRDAYRATKVFEYYTSQSYARLGDLFLVRLVSFGDISLEEYLFELEEAFLDFEEQFGNPDVRVEIISLRDDMLKIPTLDDDGQPLSQGERVERLRDALADVTLLDAEGYLTVPFGTDTDQLSPLTRNHKIAYVEAEIVGSDVGDTVGRVYLRQKGTGVIRNVEDGTNYYRFPERTAVINPFFNGQRVFSPEIYRSNRMKDRPFANTHWELVMNQKDEQANQDVNLQSITDVRLYIYYTDFTEL